MSKQAIQFWKQFSKEKYDYLKEGYDITLGEDSKMKQSSFAKLNRKCVRKNHATATNDFHGSKLYR